MFGLFKRKHTEAVVSIVFPKNYNKSPLEFFDDVELMCNVNTCKLSVMLFDTKKKQMQFSITGPDMTILNRCIAEVRLLHELTYSDFELKFKFK